MTAPEKPPLLSSWKEIAAFFGRDVRTVQRWEHEGLPVHRRPGASRSGVFAHPFELEDWLAGHTPAASTPQESPPAGEPAPPDAPRPVRHRAGTPFIVVAASLLGAVVSLAWIVAAPARTDPTPAATRPLAESREALSFPRWGDVDGNTRPDLIVSAPSVVLIFLDAGETPCRGEARDCADVRITAGSECSLHASQVSDLNGDGLEDLAVSCVLREPESFVATGPTYVVWGRPSWPGGIELPRDAGVAIEVSGRHDTRLGTCLTPQAPPDLDGDGIADLLLGAVETSEPDRGAAGMLHVFFGRRVWPPSVNASQADITIRGSRTGEGLGGPCATGDVNGDGRQDLAIGAGEDRLWDLLGSAGRTYLIENPGRWPPAIDLAVFPAMRVDGLHAGLLRRRMKLADLDADGRAELILTEPYRRSDPQYRGLTAVWRGGPIAPGVTTIERADILIEGTPGGHLGSSLDTADFDADGALELVASESGRGALVSLSPFAGVRRRLGLAAAPVLAAFDPAAADDAVEDQVAVRDDRVAQVTRSRKGRWQVILHEPYEPMQIDVRPGSADKVVLRPGVLAVGIVTDVSKGAPLPATLRAEGARPFAHKLEDVNGDGVSDLLVYFQTDDTRLSASDTTLVVTGRDRDGRFLRGAAPIRVIQTSAAR